MKRVLLLCLLVLQMGVMLYAAETDTTAVQRATIIEDMNEDVVVNCDPAIDRLLLDKINNVQREQVVIQGYRVQIFSSNKQKTAKAEAYKMEKLVIDAGIEAPVYVLYNPPFFKVRLGDFRTKEEAQSLLEEVVHVLPDLQAESYIVRSEIQVIQ